MPLTPIVCVSFIIFFTTFIEVEVVVSLNDLSRGEIVRKIAQRHIVVCKWRKNYDACVYIAKYIRCCDIFVDLYT